ncbi:Metabotropic glutamate receptor 3-like protein [Leptotrombidium deliense]|uniref:Metabotropic glutamate receptor 3-like protein n=1 Tax=Leptotrombidium deliense TaxID=299467 RepID=A0A443SKD9_9ACAR|nr:Metabotropic glutamate receptor 3-like protein [Leptotrombidium deliense]
MNALNIEINGDVTIGGIFPVNRKECVANECVTKVNDYGMQRLEAMLFAIEKINRDQLIPGVTFGAKIFDSQTDHKMAITNSLEFAAMKSTGEETSKLIGVVGASLSPVTMKVAKLLQLFSIPMISYASTSPALEDRTRYELFLRTLPSDGFPATIMTEIAKHYNWTYVSVVFSESLMPISSKFVAESRRSGICIAAHEKMSNSNENPFIAKQCETIIFRLMTKGGARGMTVFAFLTEQHFNCLLKASEDLNVSKSLTWIVVFKNVSDVTSNFNYYKGQIIDIEFTREDVKEFDKYFLQNNSKNPWSQLKSTKNYSQDLKVNNVINSVYAFANAYKNAWKSKCNNKPGTCEQLKTMTGEQFFYEFITKVNFTDLNGNNVYFDGNEVRKDYTINQLQKINGFNSFKRIGMFSKNGLLIESDKWINGVPKSVCSMPCAKGAIKLFSAGDTCCWVCVKCKTGEYVNDHNQCVACGLGYKPNHERNGCEKGNHNGEQSESTTSEIAVTKVDTDYKDENCVTEMRKVKCRMSHLEHNLLPLKYEFPSCKYD